MQIPTADEWRAAAVKINARGSMAQETIELGVLAIKDPSIKAAVERQAVAVAQLLGVKNDGVLRAALTGVMMAGLNLGLTVREQS